MAGFMLSFLMTSAAMALIIFIVLGLRAIMPEKFSPKLRYMVWVIILVGLVIPMRPMFGGGLVVIDMPRTPPPVMETVHAYYPEFSSETSRFGHGEAAGSFSILEVLAVMWLTVAGVALVYHFWRYIRFSKLVKRWGVAITDDETIEVFQSIKAENGLAKRNIGLKKCDFISTSMLVGFLRPMVLLPQKDFDAEELSLIFHHELIHYKRGDLFIKLLSVLAISLNWFNPAVYLMSAAMQADCEASCDEAVLLAVGGENRRFYAELIMEMIGDKKPVTLLSTCFYKSERGIKTRMNAIMSGHGRVKKLAFGFPALLIVTVALSGSVFAFSEAVYQPYEISAVNAANTVISAVQARDIALAEVGGGIFEGLYYDYYLGVFRIEILQENTRLYLAVDSVSGDVMIYRRGRTNAE
jgi:beta-lactamase regulating signal transducer with metallopeptidase domain